jgi:hypothetical protein
MNYRNWDFSDDQIPENFIIVVYENGNEIYEKEFEASTFDINNGEDKIEFFNNEDGINFDLVVFVSKYGIEISIETDDVYYNMDRIEFDLVQMEQEEESFSLDFYMPTLSYTKTTGSLLYGLPNEKLVPLIDITQLNRFKEYENDELIDYLHYLDLEGIEKITNEEERKNAIDQRRQEKKDIGEHITIVPEHQYCDMNFDEVIELYKRIKKKKNVIPCFTWGDKSDISVLKAFYNELKDSYPIIAIRIVEFLTLKINISKIKEIADFHIILDMNTNKDISPISSIIATVKYENFSHIIYLGTPFIAQDLSISSDSVNINSNVIKINTSLRVKRQLDSLGHKDIKYGDYCGYDRRTLIKHPKGGTPTARVVLLSLEATETILIRRAWDSRDKKIRPDGRTLIGSKKSMNRLLKDLNNGDLDFEKSIKYLDEILIDVDDALKNQYPENTSAGVLKTWCLRHNIYAIKEVYLPKSLKTE